MSDTLYSVTTNQLLPNSLHPESLSLYDIIIILLLCVNYVPYHEDMWGIEVQLHAFLSLVTDEDERLASCTSCFVPEDRAPNIHLGGCQLGSEVSMDGAMRKISVSAGN
jgi:hypothetical protein